MILHGDVLDKLQEIESESIQCVVTSPPYWGLRDYGIEGQLGLEATPELYVEKMVEVFREVKRVLKDDGTVWLNLGDSYVSGKGRYSSVQQTIAGKSRNEPINGNRPDLKGHEYLKDKDLAGIPWRVAFALRQDGWYLRQDIIWHKPNPMPESVKDRCTKSHEYIFLLSKSAKYYYDADAIREQHKHPEVTHKSDTKSINQEKVYFNNAPTNLGRCGNHELGANKRSVWTINTKPYKDAHFAVFPPKIPELCIKAGSKEGDTVLDPFFGSGTTGWVAQRLGRKWIGIELNAEYIKIAEKRFIQHELF